MKRREFLQAGIVGSVAGLLPASAKAMGKRSKSELPSACLLPSKIAGKTLKQLKADYEHRLFDLYLPFWEKGGYDKELGGFMCELNDDGSVFSDEKLIWYQGRAIWIYSYLYNNFGKDKKYLEIARKTKDFMVTQIYKWLHGMFRMFPNKRIK